MGVANLREMANDLTASGRSLETPVAVIRWGTYNGQQTVTGTLATIAEKAECAGMRAPAVIIIGEVVRLRERLNWLSRISVLSTKKSWKPRSRWLVEKGDRMKTRNLSGDERPSGVNHPSQPRAFLSGAVFLRLKASQGGGTFKPSQLGVRKRGLPPLDVR